eukprot:6190908-Lingulodinium_polyedra.AAC.1
MSDPGILRASQCSNPPSDQSESLSEPAQSSASKSSPELSSAPEQSPGRSTGAFRCGATCSSPPPPWG